MIIPKFIPVTLPEDKCPSNAVLRDIAGAFLTKEWPFVETDAITASYHRFANANCHVQRPRATAGAVQEEPLKLFIKLHKPSAEIEIFKHLMPTKQAEAIVCHEYAETGHGARTYGFFETMDGTFGRVDEFLDARQMVPEDVEDPALRAAVAREFAIFHTIKTPLELQPMQLFYDAFTQGLSQIQGCNKLKSIAKRGAVDLDSLIDYDFATKVKRVADKLGSIGARTGLCIHDVAFMNVLVKNVSLNEEENRVTFIDFEFALHNYRAFDTGAHFMQKAFTWSDHESSQANWRPYTNDEERHFCEVYAEQWNKSTGESNTAEQVLLESQHGYMLSIAWDVFNMLCALRDQGEKGDLNLAGLNKLLTEFATQYVRLGFSNTS